MVSKRDLLAEYNRRRDFGKTTEPPGSLDVSHAATIDGELQFAVQKHAARRLHFDLRLEWCGVLLSWAVTRGPSNAVSAKRLAVRTEDHPLDYANFEGTIPKGSYGGGTVMLWDIGTWQPLADVDAGLADGKLKFEVFGQRMQGAWTLVRMKRKPGEKRENWLLIKERDDFAEDDEDALVRDYDKSIATGRAMKEIANGVKRRPRKPKSPKARSPFSLPAPAFMKPQLAIAADEAPPGEAWLHETKYDGYRCLAALGTDGIRLYTRTGRDWRDRYVNLPRAFAEVRCKNALIDGEVIAAQHNGGSAFSALQQALERRLPLRFCAFDLLVLDGKELTAKPLLERKEALRNLLSDLPGDSAILFAEHIIGNGPAVFERIVEAGGEGTIAKRTDAPYRHQRSDSWLKIKKARRAEFVIGGFSPSSKRGRPFASLLVGVFEGGRLIYRGRVGSGFGERELAMLSQAFEKLARKTSPFEAVPADIEKSARWLQPRLVAEVSFAEMTADNNIRHGVFLGLREDKPAKAVTLKHSGQEAKMKIGGIAISSADRVVFPKAGMTKGDVARYYEAVGERMIREAGGRPISLLRCLEGLSGSCFFQKHAGDGFPKSLKVVDIEESDGDVAPYMYVTSPAGLVGAAQMGTLEFHIWGSKTDAIEKPDRMVFDLDPDEKLAFAEVKSAARDVRDFLADLGLASVPLVTGGKGVHVVVPLRRTVSWDTVKSFSNTVAALFAEREPARFTATMSKSKRRGRIFIDWLRNERGATAIAPFSLRAREGAPVAVPLDWDELKPLMGAHTFHTQDSLARLADSKPGVRPNTLGKSVIQRLETIIADSAES